MRVKFRDYLKEQIESRYVKPSRSTRFASNEVPWFFYEESMMKNVRINGRQIISPNLAVMADHRNAKAITFFDLIQYSGVRLNRLKANLEKIKRNNNINLVSIGYGGFSINVLHFMSLLSKEIGVHNWLNNITIYEDDKISFTNSFRIYKDMSAIQYSENGHKFNLMGDDCETIAKKIHARPSRFNSISVNDILSKEEFGDNTFFFGAPDFETRKLLEEVPFIFTGHSGNEVEFYYSPKVDSELTRETYGKIDLDYFFLNILKSAEKLIDIMANNSPKDFEKDTLIFKYTSEGTV